MKSRRPLRRGYTLIELMLVITILSILASIGMPRVELILQKARQSTARSSLASLRSAISIYYTDNNGAYPLSSYPDGFPDALGQSLTQNLTPKYFTKLDAPRLDDRMPGYNGLSTPYDDRAAYLFSQTPPKDLVILRGPAGPTPLIDRPFAYDPDTGLLYYANGNYDAAGSSRFYEW